MTEKEFENLKVGDKVWIITDWLGTIGEGMKAHQKEVAGKDEDKHEIQCIGCSLVSGHCYLSKAEAWEAEVKEYENAVKAEEEYLAKKRQTLERYKSELAKAKEEENQPSWFVDFDSGEVFLTWIQDGDDTRNVFPTKQDAYEALAKHYKGKYEEALSKAGKINWVVVGKHDPKIYAIFNAKVEDGLLAGVDYDGYRFCPVCHNGLFSSRQEAEAQLKREKDGD